MAVSRREMDVEDYIDIVRRHKSWILGPALAGLVVSVVVAFLWPDTFVSSASIKVLPPQIPESMVPVTFQMDMQQRIGQMRESILSRANLTNLVTTHQLYPRERRQLPMADIIEMMRNKAISVRMSSGAGPAGGGQRAVSFTVSFSYENRYLAQKVCADLVSKFIDENVRERSSIAGQTKDFIDDQWQTRKRELDAIEEQLAKFKTANLGRTPEQQGSTIQAMTSIENRMANINAALARVSQDRLILENHLNTLREQLRQVTTPVVENLAPTPKSDRLLSLERDITNAETRLQSLREQYQDSHPAVKNFLSDLAIIKRERDRLQAEQTELENQQKATKKTILRPEAAREARVLESQIAQTQARIEATKIEEQTYKKSEMEAEGSARALQSTLASMPANEKEYEQLRFQAMMARRDFEETDRLKQRANAAVELENRKQTEKLEILDPASLPTNPTEPKRWIIILGGALGGLVLGIVLAGAREVKDSTLKNLKDARAYTQLTVLGCIPLLENDLVVRRRRRLAWLAWSTSVLASIAIMAGAIFYYFQNK
ncbi:MAG: Wzz/FepE/Etk N-terminal domain-containing protein [Bryobacter sp.]|nr:Wzz/FepE/Etk N-terminal domain-containing protein [Bryobacter sp.]